MSFIQDIAVILGLTLVSTVAAGMFSLGWYGPAGILQGLVIAVAMAFGAIRGREI